MIKQIHHILAKTPLLLRVVSLYVVIGSVFGIYFYVAPPVKAVPPTVSVPVVTAVEPVLAQPEVISGVPRRIDLPRIGLVREVIDGTYDAATQTWTLTDDKTQYAVMTKPLNDKAGQTVIYGHNTNAVLELVKQVAVGDELLVTSDNGHTFVYSYTHDRFVDPTDTSVLYEEPDSPRVVLMTCEGWLSTTRRLLYFDLKEVR